MTAFTVASDIHAVLKDFGAPVLVALLMGGPAWLTARGIRRDNDSQHSDNLTVLTEVRDRVGRMEEKVDAVGDKVDAVDVKIERHLGEHAGAASAQPGPVQIVTNVPVPEDDPNTFLRWGRGAAR